MRSLRSQLIVSHLVLVLITCSVMIGASITFFQIAHSVGRVVRGNFRTVLAAQKLTSAIKDQSVAAEFLSENDRGNGPTALPETR